MLYLDLDKMLYDMKYENVDMDTDGTGDTVYKIQDLA